MAGRPTTPTLRRKELGARLKKLRLARDLTAEQVAERLMVSATKISRLETGSRGVNPRDIRDLCEIYQVGADEREHLMTLATQSRAPSRWQDYDTEYSTWTELEGAAASISHFKSDVVPGLLQTEAYARAVLEATLSDSSEDRVTQLAESRRVRRRRLEGDSPVELRTVLDEGVLRRAVGGAATMHEQVQALIERADQSNVTIQVIPFEAGAHPALSSTFEILHFEQAAPDVVYVEGLFGQHYLQNRKELARYKRVFEQLQSIALDPRQSVALLRRAAKSYAG